MFSSILVPLDGSELAEQALATASRLVHGGEGGLLHLVTVHHPPLPPPSLGGMSAYPGIDEDARDQEIRYLEKVAARVRTEVPRVHVSVQEGWPPAQALVRYIEANGVDAVVMTSHGRTGFSRLWLGSVAENLIRRSPVPVICLRKQGTDMRKGGETLERLLLPLDGSAEAEAILEPALTFARRWENLTLELLRVVEPVPVWEPAMGNVFTPAPPDMTRVQLEANRYLHDLAMKVRAAGFRVHAEVLVDQNPASVIVEHAQRLPGTAVAMTTHGRGGLGRLVLGSVADKVLRSATGPVLTQLAPSRVERAGRDLSAAALEVSAR